MAKCTSGYTIGSLSKRRAEDEGYSGALHTPTPEGFLDGITRRTVMSLARRRQMAVGERPIEAAEIALASEVFLARTATTPAKLLKHRYATMQRWPQVRSPM